MHATLILGNVSPLEAYKEDPEVNDTSTRPLAVPKGADGVETFVNLEEPSLSSALRSLDDLWQYHGDDLPEWVECGDSKIADAVATHFSQTLDDGTEHTCQVGRPSGWKAGDPSSVAPAKEVHDRIAKAPRKKGEKAEEPARSRLDTLKEAFEAEWDHLNRRIWDSGVPIALRTNAGADLQADAMGAGVATATGTSTGVTATTMTDSGASWTTNAHAGRLVTCGSRYGVVLSNTGTVLTIDKWYNPASPGGAAGSSPATGTYVILPGNSPAAWIALTENVTTPVVGDTTLASELAAGGGGLVRALATYAHTAAATTYTLTNTYTVNGSDAPPKTPGKIGVFGAAAGGRLAFATLLTAPPALQSGDQLTITETVSLV